MAGAKNASKAGLKTTNSQRFGVVSNLVEIGQWTNGPESWGPNWDPPRQKNLVGAERVSVEEALKVKDAKANFGRGVDSELRGVLKCDFPFLGQPFPKLRRTNVLSHLIRAPAPDPAT